MVYVLQQNQRNYNTPNSQSALVDPAVIRAAGDIYRTYCEVHPEMMGQPSGVAINRSHHRGKVIFTNHPVLLPEECFIPLNQIESNVY